MRILIVDDSQTKRDEIAVAIAGIVGTKSPRIDYATNVNEACRCCRKTSFDLIILDVFLPIEKGGEPIRKGGISVLKNLRNQEILKSPKNLVGLTAYEDVLEGLRAEFEKDNYVLLKYDPASIDWQSKLSAALGRVTRSPTSKNSKSILPKLAIDGWCAIAMLLVLIGCIFLPIHFTPTSRAITFFLCSTLAGILMGSKFTAKFSLKLPMACITASGATGALLATMFLLQNLTSTNLSVGVYHARNHDGQTINLDPSSISVEISDNAIPPQVFANGSSLVVIFPQTTENANISVRSDNGDLSFTGCLRYTPGTTQSFVLSEKK